MNRRPLRFLLLFAPLALLAALGLHLALRDAPDAERGIAPAPGGVRRVAGVAPAAGASDDASRAPGSGSPATAGADLGRSAAAAPESAALDLARAAWISGRVRFPAGAPPDAGLSVLACAADDRPAAGDPVAPGSPARALLTSLQGRGKPFAVLPVAADGSFRVPHRPDAQRIALQLDGEFLYLAEPALVDAGSASVELEPALGGALRVRLHPPLGMSAADLVAAEVSLHSGSPSDMGFGFGVESGRPERRELLDGRLEAQLGGLDPARVYALACDPGSAAPWRERGLRVEPGRVQLVEGQPLRGALVRGRVTGPEGEPLAGAEVRAQPAEPMLRMLYGESRRAITAADGTYELRGVAPAGSAEVRATLAGFLAGVRKEVELLDGVELSRMDLALAAGLGLEGIVLGPDRGPYAGARIDVRRAERDARERSDPGTATTDAEGRFAVAGLEPGRYTLVAREREPRRGAAAPEPDAPAQEPGAARADAPEARPSVEPLRAEARAVEAGGPRLELVLARPRGIAGRVVGPDGLPLTSFRVRASAGSDSYDDRFAAASGAFELAGPFDGVWSVRVEADDHVQPAALEVRVPQEGELEIRLERGARLAGRVLDPDGNPQAQARVVLRHGAAARAGSYGSASRLPESRSDEHGRFTLARALPGHGRLVATHEAWSESEELAVELDGGALHADLTLVLRRGGVVEGLVYDAQGSPEAGRMVMAMSAAGGRMPSTVTTDAGGGFRFERLAAGRYQIIAQPSRAGLEKTLAGGQRPDTSDILQMVQAATAEVLEGQTVQVVLGAPPAAPVRLFGRVTRAGTPVRKGGVTALAEGRSMMEGWKSAQLGGDGAYELTLDQPGDVILIFSEDTGIDSGGFRGGPQYPVRVPAAEAHRFDLELPTGSLAGRVLGPAGVPLVGQRVRLSNEERSSSPLARAASSVTDAEGRFRFEDLEAGRYAVQAGGRGLGSQSYGTVIAGDIELAEGGAREDVVLRLGEPVRLEGKVVGADGRPADGATVHARDGAGRLLTEYSGASTGADGRFRLEGLAPGAVYVSARDAQAASEERGPIEVRSGEVAAVELALAPGTRLRIVVEDASGEPVAAAVRVLDERGRDHAGARTQESMAALFVEGISSREQKVGPLPPGRYTILATVGGTTVDRTVTLRGGAERTVTLRLAD